MSKRPASNTAASVKARLLNKARRGGRDFNQLLQHYGLERFLYRLGLSSHAGKFILKGALMLRTLGVEMWRPTMDIDLLGKVRNDRTLLRKVIHDCCAVEVDDGITFTWPPDGPWA